MTINLKSLESNSLFDIGVKKRTNSRLEYIEYELEKLDKEITKLTNKERDLIYEKTRIEVALGVYDK